MTMRTIGKMLLWLVASIIVGAGLLILVYALPVQPMREHISSSINIILQEGNAYSWAGMDLEDRHASAANAPSVYAYSTAKEKIARLRMFSNLGRFTEAIMLNTAVYSSDKPGTLIHDAMLSQNVVYRDSDGGEEYHDNAEHLSRVIKSKTNEGGTISAYARYWHGYLVYLKPLLWITTIPVIKILNFVIQFFLLIVVILKISDKIGKAYAFAFALAMLVIDPIATAMSFDFANVYYVILIMSAVMLYHNDELKKNDGYCIFFEMGGICTAYFDFLTYPFASLGIPTILYLLMNNDMKLSEKISGMIKTGLSWVFGYGGVWAGKWILASLITGKDVIDDALKTVAFRINGSGPSGLKFTWYEKFHVYFSYLSGFKAFWIAMIIMCILLVLIVLYMCMSVRKGKTTAAEIIPLCLAFLYTFVWYAVVQNHTIIHFKSVANKLLCVSVFAAACIAVKCSGYKRNG